MDGVPELLSWVQLGDTLRGLCVTACRVTNAPMDRARLQSLHDACLALLALDASALDLIEQIMRRDKPNGLDSNPASASPVNPRVPASGADRANPLTPSPEAVERAERALMDVMRANPGASVNALAAIASAPQASTGARLKRLEARGAVHRGEGGWVVDGEGGGIRPT